MNIKSLLFLSRHAAKHDSSNDRTDDDVEDRDPFGEDDDEDEEEDYGLGDDLGIDTSPSVSDNGNSGSPIDGISFSSPAPNGSVSTPSSKGIGEASAPTASPVSQGEPMMSEATDAQASAPSEGPSDDAGEGEVQSDDPEMDSILDIFTEEEGVDEDLGNLVKDLAELDMDDLLAECYELAGALQERAGY